MVFFRLKKATLKGKLGLTKKFNKIKTGFAKNEAELQKLRNKIGKAKTVKLTASQTKLLKQKIDMRMKRNKEIRKNAGMIAKQLRKGASALAKEALRLQGRKAPKRRK